MKTIMCKNCGRPIEVDEQKSAMVCPFCATNHSSNLSNGSSFDDFSDSDWDFVAENQTNVVTNDAILEQDGILIEPLDEIILSPEEDIQEVEPFIEVDAFEDEDTLGVETVEETKEKPKNPFFFAIPKVPENKEDSTEQNRSPVPKTPFSFGSMAFNVSETYNLKGKCFNVGDEDRAIDYIYAKNLISVVFVGDGCTFSETFVKLTRHYLIRREMLLVTLQNQVNEIYQVVKDQKSLFAFVMIMMTGKLIINDSNHATYLFGNQTDLAKKIATQGASFQNILLDNLGKIHLFACLAENPLDSIKSSDKRKFSDISKFVFEKTNTLVGISRGGITSFGKEADFVDSLLVPKKVEEKNAVLNTIFKNFVTHIQNDRCLDNEFLRTFSIDQSSLGLYLENLEFAATKTTAFCFDNGASLPKNENEYIILIDRYLNKGDNSSYNSLLLIYNLYLIKFFNSPNTFAFDRIGVMTRDICDGGVPKTFSDFLDKVCSFK